MDLEEAALVDGLGIWRAFLQTVLPGMVAAFILNLELRRNEYFCVALLTATDAKTVPVIVASQTGLTRSIDGRWQPCRQRSPCH